MRRTERTIGCHETAEGLAHFPAAHATLVRRAAFESCAWRAVVGAPLQVRFAGVQHHCHGDHKRMNTRICLQMTGSLTTRVEATMYYPVPRCQ